MSVGKSRRIGLAALGAVLIVAAVAVLSASPASALPVFGTAAVSLPGSGSAGPANQVVIKSVTVSHHAGFDRVVFASRDGRPAISAEYVSQVISDASGQPVSLLGSAFLRVTLRDTVVESSPQPTITPGFPALCQLKGAGAVEAVTSYGIGQATKDGFRVFASSQTQIALDLAIAGGSLASTGVPTLPLTILGFSLLVAGLGACLLARRPLPA
jgi:hypothetical protein